jgi:hypothetical protein
MGSSKPPLTEMDDRMGRNNYNLNVLVLVSAPPSSISRGAVETCIGG